MPDPPKGHDPRELHDGRYVLGERIGQGAQGITWRATDRASGETVVVKELRVQGLSEWKAIELFEREGEALARLDHPAIPRYVDAFHVEGDAGPQLFLVQACAEGTPLDRAMAQGLRLDEGQARDFVRRLLEICAYIHGLDPPVIHRDIKPSNVLRRPDGALSLVDFGAVQTVLPASGGGSTVVGTTGYMPLEQLMGRATPATDLYAVGATAIHLLSHRHPAELEVVEMRLQFREAIRVSAGFAAILSRLVEPHLEDRFETAGQALEALERLSEQPLELEAPRWRRELRHAPEALGARHDTDEAAGEAAHQMQVRGRERPGWTRPFLTGELVERPPESLWEERWEGETRILRRPPGGLRDSWGAVALAAVGLLAATAIWANWGAGADLASAAITALIIGLVLGGGFLMFGRQWVRAAFGLEEIELTPQELVHRKVLFGREERHTLVISRLEVDFVWTSSPGREGGDARERDCHLVLRSGYETYELGEGLSRDELLWCASTIRDHARAHGRYGV